MEVASDPEVDLVIRLATNEDYDQVMAIIPDLYDGRDYLPKYYDAMISHPDRIALVYLVDGKIMAFGMFLVMNGGKSVLRQSGRICDQFRGKGLAANAIRLSLLHMWRRYPDVNTLQTVFTGDQVFQSIMAKESNLLRSSHRLLARIQMETAQSITMDIQTKENSHKNLPMDSTRILTPSEAIDILMNLRDIDNIREEYTWCVNAELFGHFESDYNLLTRSNVIPAVMAVTHNPNDANENEAVSFGAKTDLKNGVLFRIDFYCAKIHRASNYGVELIKAHILKHLGMFAQLKCKGPAFIEVLYPRDMTSLAIGTWLLEVLNPKKAKLLAEQFKVYFIDVDVSPFKGSQKL